jgi:hypothetical protein
MTGTGTPSLRRALLVLLALISVLTAAGCVNLPANTSVSAVDKQAKAGSGADVRIWPQAPQRNENPLQIVEGFIQTAASDPSNRGIAEAYLTGDALSWHPDRVVVFSEVSSPSLVSPPDASGDVQIQISGTIVATVSDDGGYHQVFDPKELPYTFDLTNDQAKGYYRIDRLPGDDFGILLTQEAFRANYAAYYLYYLNGDAPTSSMIPVPDYQRSQTGDAATAQHLASALFAGPPDALTGIASLAAPRIELASQVTIGTDDTASVPIKTPNYCTTHPKGSCDRLADELLATFSNLASIAQVTVVDPQGAPLASSSKMDDVASRFHLGVGGAKTASFYFLDTQNHRVNRYDPNGSNNPLADQLGPETRRYSQLAIGFYAGQSIAAATDDKAGKLYLGAPGVSKDAPPVATESHISSLTWDTLGHLWFLDSAGTAAATLYRVDMTAGGQPAVQAAVVFGQDGGTIDQIAVAPDGRRIAIRYSVDGSTPGTSAYSVGIGTVEDGGSELSVNLSFGVDQPVVDHWLSVLDMDWHGSQALAVLGSQSPSTPLTISELNSDGSPVVSAADLNPVTFTPPPNTIGIEWIGSVLLAATRSAGNPPAAQQIEQYSFTSTTWSSTVNGFSPSYLN